LTAGIYDLRSSESQSIEPASNWLERLRRIRQMHERLSAERAKANPAGVHSLTSKPSGDFADFVK